MNEDIKWLVESVTTKLEITIKRLWILCIILIVLFTGSNLAWIIYESQWQVVDTTTEIKQEVQQENEGEGSNTFIGGNYGEADSKNNDN